MALNFLRASTTSANSLDIVAIAQLTHPVCTTLYDPLFAIGAKRVEK